MNRQTLFEMSRRFESNLNLTKNDEIKQYLVKESYLKKRRLFYSQRSATSLENE
jgi:hypothetical protein